MIYAAPGQTFEATLENAPSGLTGTAGVRILDGAGGTTLGRSTAGINEFPAGSGFYTVTLTAPVTAGQYAVMWDTGVVSPSTTAYEDLTVTFTAPATVLLTAANLCSLDGVRERMQKKVTDTAQDDMILRFIPQASRQIMRWTEREFAPAMSAAARVFEWPRTGSFLSLAPYDLRAVTSIQVDTDLPDPITLTVDEYRLWPKPAKDGVYLALRLHPLNMRVGVIPWANREVTVTGDWGWTVVPDDVISAAEATVVHWLTVNVAAFRRPDEQPDGPNPPRRGIPPEALQALQPYKRAVVG